MRALLGALVALSLGCGLAPPTAIAWRSPLGVSIAQGELQDYFTPDVVDAYTAHATAGMAALGRDPARLRWATEQIVVEVQAEPIPCVAGTTGLCAGVEEDNFLRVKTAECVHWTALQHEMLHWYSYATTGDADPGHTRAEVWAIDVPPGVCEVPFLPPDNP